MSAEWKLSPVRRRSPTRAVGPEPQAVRFDSRGDEPAGPFRGEFARTPRAWSAERTSEEADPLRLRSGCGSRCAMCAEGDVLDMLRASGPAMLLHEGSHPRFDFVADQPNRLDALPLWVG